MEIKKALELEREKQQIIGEIVLNLSGITSRKDMAEIQEFVKNKVLD